MTALVCFCACPDLQVAQRIADVLVGERLAACVNLLPGMRSVYHWEAAMQHDDEVLLLIKTTRDCLEELNARIVSLHPYELPEVLAVEVAGGSRPYLDWLAQTVLPEGTLARTPADHPPPSGV